MVVQQNIYLLMNNIGYYVQVNEDQVEVDNCNFTLMKSCLTIRSGCEISGFQFFVFCKMVENDRIRSKISIFE
jgi:hypothetical protein